MFHILPEVGAKQKVFIRGPLTYAFGSKGCGGRVLKGKIQIQCSFIKCPKGAYIRVIGNWYEIILFYFRGCHMSCPCLSRPCVDPTWRLTFGTQNVEPNNPLQ